MDDTDLMIYIKAAEDVCQSEITKSPVILEGMPQYLEQGQTRLIQYDEKSGELEEENKKDDEVREHPDIVALATANTQWFQLPADHSEAVKLVKKGARELSGALNKIREHCEYQHDRKLRTVRTRCNIERDCDKVYPPFITQPPENSIRLIIRHALTPE